MTGACVECLENFHCLGRGECIDHRCIECWKNADCASGVCGADRKCQPPRPCGEEGECPPGFACHRSENLCWPVCDVLWDPYCHAGHGCAIVGVVNGKIVSACVPETGTAGPGQSCGEEDENLCSVALVCANEPSGRICREFCDRWSIPCRGDLECVLSPVTDTGTGEEATIGVCREPLRACESAADCFPNEFCEFGTCFRKNSANGNKGPGVPCTQNQECASGWCLERGVCSGSCTRTGHCAAGTDCVRIAVSSDPPVEGNFCVPTCKNDTDCPSDQTCNFFLNGAGDGLVTICAPRVGTRSAGEACTSGLQCRSGHCFGAPNGYCSGICEKVLDCNHPMLRCGQESITDRWGFPIGAVPMCVGIPCSKEADCGGWSCQFATEGFPRELVTRCEPPVGTKRGGLPCSSHSECRSGFCYGVACVELCDDDFECVTGVCADGAQGTFDGKEYEFSTCWDF